MGYFINLFLNLAGLLLWLSWCSVRFDPLYQRKPATLMGTLRRAEPQRFKQWHLPIIIIALLLLRAVLYYWIGSAADWIAKLDLGVTVLPFRSDWFLRILVFSFCSFGATLVFFYLCLLPLSLLAGPEPIHSFVKIPLGRVDAWPVWARVILPLIVTATLWWTGSWLFTWLQILPTPAASAQRIEQSIVIGLDGYLAWRYPLALILLLYLVSSYIYFGKHPFWKYVEATAQKLLSPLRGIPLRVGRMDFAPIITLALILLVAHLLEHGLYLKFAHIPGLIGIFQRLPM
jgi:uncharacterized protein YggT (Ycf19 family)